MMENSLSMPLMWMTMPRARMALAQHSFVTCVKTMIHGVSASPMYFAISKPVQRIDTTDSPMLAHSHLQVTPSRQHTRPASPRSSKPKGATYTISMMGHSPFRLSLCS